MRQKPISELRRRMLEDMSVRKFSEATCRNYIRHIAEFAKFLGRSPDTATADLRQFGPHAGALTTRRQHACDRLALACEDMRWANPSPCLHHRLAIRLSTTSSSSHGAIGNKPPAALLDCIGVTSPPMSTEPEKSNLR